MATAAAKRYARAVFELAKESGQTDDWTARLARVRDLAGDPRVAAALTNPTIDSSRRMQLVSGTKELDPEATNLLKLLIESSRIGEIDGVVDEYERLMDEAAGRVRATVTTAVKLADADRARLASQLSKTLGKEVRLSVVVDSRILGGLRLQFGDRLIDATVATRLQQLRRRLADAS